MNRITEFLKQSFYIVGIISFIIILNVNFRPDGIVMPSLVNESSTTEIITTEVIKHEYVTPNMIGFIAVMLLTVCVVAGVLFGLTSLRETHRENRKLEKKTGRQYI